MRACFCIEGQFPKVGFFNLDTLAPHCASDISAASVVGSERNKPVLIELVVEGL